MRDIVIAFAPQDHVSTDAHSSQPGSFFRPLPWRWLVAILAAGAALRLLFILRWPIITPDGVVYADIAKNWLQHGIYGATEDGVATATYIRLPGYPAFLAAIFALAGSDHFNAVRFVQLAVDLLTCFVVADLARRVLSRAAAGCAFVLYALCPFVANYVAVPLTETLAIFSAVAALDCAIAAMDSATRRQSNRAAVLCGLATAYGILLRPDGGIVLMTIGGFLLYCAARQSRLGTALRLGSIIGLIALAPLAPWAWRNWRVFHEWQPLVPIAANAPGEYVATGFDRWQRTWLVDYSGLIDAGFKVDGEPIEIGDLPAVALGKGKELDQTVDVIEEYNQDLVLTPAIDRHFRALADERIRRSPLRYLFLLPALRAADMWLRPRTELLPVDSHFWDWDEGWRDIVVSAALGLLNLFFILAAVHGLRRQMPRYAGLLLGFCALRTAIVTGLSGPEPRYVLECFPVLIVLAAAAFRAVSARRAPESQQSCA